MSEPSYKTAELRPTLEMSSSRSKGEPTRVDTGEAYSTPGGDPDTLSGLLVAALNISTEQFSPSDSFLSHFTSFRRSRAMKIFRDKVAYFLFS